MDQVTINEYKPSQGIRPHVDTASAFHDGIASLSLGAPTIMDFRHQQKKNVKKSVLLNPRFAQNRRFIPIFFSLF